MFIKNKLILSIYFLLLFSIIIYIFPLSLIYLNLSKNINEKIGEYLFLSRFKYDDAILFLEKSNQNQKNTFLLGRIHFVKNDLVKSIEYYTKSINLYNENGGNKDIYMQSYYGRGLAYGFYSTLFLKEAEDDFKKYIEIENLNFGNTEKRAHGAWAGYNDLAWIYFLQNDLKNAEKTARKGLAISPTNPWLLNILGATLMGEEKYIEAKDSLILAKRYLKDISAQEWGEAYSGDNSKLYKQGRENMLKTIEENIFEIDSITQNNIK